MRSSIRGRLQAWDAVLLLTVVGAFAGILYYRVSDARLREADARLEKRAAPDRARTLLVWRASAGGR